MADVTFPSVPRVVSLLHYDDIDKTRNSLPVAGYPVICVTVRSMIGNKYLAKGFSLIYFVNDSLSKAFSLTSVVTERKILYKEVFSRGAHFINTYLESSGAVYRNIAVVHSQTKFLPPSSGL